MKWTLVVFLVLAGTGLWSCSTSEDNSSEKGKFLLKTDRYLHGDTVSFFFPNLSSQNGLKIGFSDDSGFTYEDIDYFDTHKDTGRIILPAVNCEFCGLQIKKGGAGKSTLFLLRDLILINPTGKKSYRLGDTIQIQWKFASNTVSSAAIDIRLDGIGSPAKPIVVGSVMANSVYWGNYPWIPGPEDLCNNCVIEVSDYLNPDVYDYNRMEFSISR